MNQLANPMTNPIAPSTRKLMKLFQNARTKGNANVALGYLQQVLQINPDHVEALHESAVLLHAIGNYDAALEFYQRVIQRDGAHVQSYILLSKLMEDRNRPDDAIKLAELAVTVAPENAFAHASVASIYLKHRGHEVPAYLEKILPQFPDDLELHQFYAIALKVNNRRAEADNVYAALCKKFRVPASFRMIYETLLPRFYVSTDEIDAVRTAFATSIENFIRERPSINLAMLSNHPLFALPFHNRDNKQLLQRYTHMLRRCAPELNYVAPHCKSPLSVEGRRLRIGFISSHMHHHSVGSCYRNVMIQLAAQPEVEVTFFNLVNVMDEKIQEIIAAQIPIISLPKSFVAAHKLVADKKLDLIIYPDIGMDAPTHYMAMARLAPHQACFQGHPETTGIDTIDYVISSRRYEPPHADENYTERLLCHPGIDTVFQRPDAPERWLTRAELGLPEGKKLYVCPMAIQKLHPDFDAVLAEILARDPHAVIVLFNDFMQQIASHLLQQRIVGKCDASRVIFLSWQPREVLFSIMKQADAVLDTIYFGGGTTAQYAFAFGCPIVTMPGHYARGRMVFAYYETMGIADAPIADSLQSYAMVAVKLANDTAYAARLRKDIAAKSDAVFENSAHGPRPMQLVSDIIHQRLDSYRR